MRLALGAEAHGIGLLILKNGLALVVAGIVVGVAAALIAGPVLESQLFQTDARDPVAFAGVATLLTVVALLATFIPARRAARVPPHAALRGE